ncbi:pyridoxamine 5'-phosphate oxidase family protein [Streptomyces sp. N2-109]|uniref:Pyridoxamine 5'-phosphate oxidase family protein n=1 Tax=Streptomyces gossypii TaxID=2883101 RepID=A0ABT2K0B1_9ACTN|nr:pyridoxamine 5'-phosphate oxidase family protein [Streptomyces gossypii]MCT2593588.1 pyridoxamine 5'-phosphate oxidase family protein [Streptomyces gossypii]
MKETPEDLDRLQRLLDDSYAAAGTYLRSVLAKERRLDAAGVVAELGAVHVMALATTTAGGEPRVGPTDGLFYRGRLYFYSGAGSVRFRHIRARPAVSASVIDGERLQITVHGQAREVIPTEDQELAAFLIEVYGREEWDRSRSALSWARIEPNRMITYRRQASRKD